MPPDATLEGGRCSDLLVDSLGDKQLISKINAYPPDDIHLVRTYVCRMTSSTFFVGKSYRFVP